tara:strand:- start:357 stop:581 length:225 start_codon:yes stop_codon:yes gene_type:complete
MSDNSNSQSRVISDPVTTQHHCGGIGYKAGHCFKCGEYMGVDKPTNADMAKELPELLSRPYGKKLSDLRNWDNI